jgi:hypothetical protein
LPGSAFACTNTSDPEEPSRTTKPRIRKPDRMTALLDLEVDEVLIEGEWGNLVTGEEDDPGASLTAVLNESGSLFATDDAGLDPIGGSPSE